MKEEAAHGTLDVDVVSDLHVEGHEGYERARLLQRWDSRWRKIPALDQVDWLQGWGNGPIGGLLIVAGDVANDPETACAVLRAAAGRWARVAWVDGNHEHYGTRVAGTDVDANLEAMDRALAGCANVVRLDDGQAVDDAASGTRVVGCNGWYDWNAATGEPVHTQRARWGLGLNDARAIGFGARLPDDRARTQARDLQEALDRAQADESVHQVVVVTHTVPREGERWQGRYARRSTPDHLLNGSFVSNAMATVQSPKLKAWVYGHTHEACTHDDGNVLWVCNPRGWPGERTRGIGRYRATRIRCGRGAARLIGGPNRGKDG